MELLLQRDASHAFLFLLFRLRNPIRPVPAVVAGRDPAQARVPAPTDSATFLLHKFGQRIGQETYRVTRTAQPTPTT